MGPSRIAARRRVNVCLCATLFIMPAAPALAQNCFTWTNATPAFDGPTPRQRASMAYDSTRNVTVLFSGSDFDLTNPFSDTWEWDGASWTLRSTTGPVARFDAEMVFDSFRGVCVLFGGRDKDGIQLNDTWEWNGTAWTQKFPVTSPTPRDSFGLAYDSNRHRVQLWGGFNGTNTQELWEYNGTNWVLRNSTGPIGRYWSALAYDPLRSRTVLFGGWDGASDYADTWEYNGATNSWTQIFPLVSPGPRSGQSTAYIPGLGVAVYGGQHGSFGYAEIWTFDGSTWTRGADGYPPAARWNSNLVYDALHAEALLFGGALFSGSFNDLWAYANDTWTPRSNYTPADRYTGWMAYDRARDQLILYGGVSASYIDDTWTWDGTRWVSLALHGPGARSTAALTYDNARQVVTLFGGEYQLNDTVQNHDDTWNWDGSTWTQVFPAAHPSARTCYNSFQYDADRDVSVLFGGFVSATGERLADTWEWDGSNWTQKFPAHAPSGRTGQGMIFDPDRHVIVLFGGRDVVTRNGDTWTYDGNDWTLVSTTGPSPRSPGWLAWDADSHAIVLFGGIDASGAILNDTWIWNGLAWRQVASGGPAPRNASSGFYDIAHQRVVLYGGLDSLNLAFSDTWLGDLTLPTGDLNLDGTTDLTDLATLLANYGASGAIFAQGDLDGSGVIDLTDLAALLTGYGSTCQ